MQNDSGRTAMWICSALVGLLRHKGVVGDGELGWIAAQLEREAIAEDAEKRVDMQRAAQWFRQSIPPAND